MVNFKAEEKRLEVERAAFDAERVEIAGMAGELTCNKPVGYHEGPCNLLPGHDGACSAVVYDLENA